MINVIVKLANVNKSFTLRASVLPFELIMHVTWIEVWFLGFIQMLLTRWDFLQIENWPDMATLPDQNMKILLFLQVEGKNLLRHSFSKESVIIIG